MSPCQNVCGYWISFVTRGDSRDNAVILPNIVTEVIITIILSVIIILLF